MLAKLAVERVPGVFHTTNQGAVSWYGFARAVFAAGGHDPDRISPITTAELDPPRPAPRPANSVLDNLAWRLHGFTPSRDFREPLAEVVARLAEPRDRLTWLRHRAGEAPRFPPENPQVGRTFVRWWGVVESAGRESR